MLRYIYHQLLALMLLAVVACNLASCSRSPHGEERRLLVVHTYDNGLGEYAQQVSEYYRQAAADSNLNLSIRHIYLGQPYVLRDVSNAMLRDTLQGLVREGWLPDVVTVHGDEALDSYLSLSDSLSVYAGIPTVFASCFCADSLLRVHRKAQMPITGYRDSLFVRENLSLLSELFPGERGCMIELDSSLTDVYARRVLHEALRDTLAYVDNCDFHLGKDDFFRFASDTTENRLLIFTISVAFPDTNHKLQAGMNQDSIMDVNRDYVLSTFRNAKYFKQIQVSYSDYSNSVIDQSRRPQLSMINAQFMQTHPTRILGGYFPLLETEVGDAIGYVMHILDGAPVSSLPVRMHQPDWYLDWNAMMRLHLRVADMHPRFNIMNITMSASNPASYDLLRLGLILLLSIVFTIALFTVLYLIMRHRRRIDDFQMAQLEYLLGGDTSAMWQYQMGEFILSAKMKRMFETKIEVISVSDFVLLVHPDDQATASRLCRFEEAEGHHTHRLRIRSVEDPTYHWYEFDYTITSVAHLHSSLEGLVTKIDDLVVEEERIQNVLQTAEETKLKEAFLANMTHDIRSPLSTIVSFANMLGTDGLTLPAEERKVFVEQIEKSTNVMLRLLSDVVDVSRMQMGEYRFMMQQQSVRSIVEEAHAANDVLMPKHIEFLLQTDDDATIYIDSARLAQVLNNFLSNAIKNTTEGHITLGWKLCDQWVDIFVEDTGVGIDTERQKTIFEKFTKFDGQTGAGLGLNICKTIVEKQNGRISVESTLGVGSRFTASFPLSAKNNTTTER